LPLIASIYTKIINTYFHEGKSMRIKTAITRLLRRVMFPSAALLGISAAFISVQAQQTYPNQPIRIVVGYAAGGTTDILARSLGEQMGKILGQTIIVDNKPGAASNIGAAYVAQSKPDGYTLYMATVASHGIKPA
jgi:tripartite-type tricarboxylate transporter receptor subunit TctC